MTGAVLAMLPFFLGTFGTIYYTTQRLQFVLGYGPLTTGVRLLPLGAAVFAGAALTGPLTPRLGTRHVVTAGMALGTVAVFLLTRIDGTSAYTDFLPTLLLLGLAIGLSTSPCSDTITGAFPEADLGGGGSSSNNDTAIELGGSLGIAALGSILATTHKDTLSATLTCHLPPAALDTATGGARAVAQDPADGSHPAQALTSAADHAFAHAIAHTSLIGGIVLAAGTLLVALILPAHRPAVPPRCGDARCLDRLFDEVGFSMTPPRAHTWDRRRCRYAAGPGVAGPQPSRAPGAD